MRKLILALIPVIGMLCFLSHSQPSYAGYFSQPATIDQEDQTRLMKSLFLPDENSTLFNSETWRKDIKSRRNMLFDLCHQPDINKAAVLRDLLGAPDNLGTEPVEMGDYKDIYYELGLQNGHYTFLQIMFESEKPEYMMVVQKYLDVTPAIVPRWTDKNKGWQTLAEEYNRKFFIVGMPVTVIEDLGGEDEGQKTRVHKVHRCNDLEYECTPDGSKVSRFRMLYETAQGTKGSTQWEETDLRREPRCLANLHDYRCYGEPGGTEDMKFEKFTPHLWKTQKNQLGAPARDYMVESLTRSYPLIGMTKEQITALLGKADTRKYSKEEMKADPYFTDAECYVTGSGWCGNGGYGGLEISFKDNRVVAYRARHIMPMGGSNLGLGGILRLNDKE